MTKQRKLDVGLPEFDIEDTDDNNKSSNNIPLEENIVNENSADKQILTISELTERIKIILERNESLMNIWVRGEISNLRVYGSGHLYFTLKDEAANLSCVKFKGAGKKVRFEIEHGMKIKARGRISVYSPQGKYQFIIDEIQPDGLGSLHMAFLQLKDKLAKEGIFDDIHKKSLPEFPEVIGIATSLAGAAIKDIIKVIKRRYRGVTIYCVQTQVQGEGAAESIINSLEILDGLKEVDVIIAGRGGGSLEDLWAFNEEPVVRKIFQTDHPVVSAVGHEIDYTLSDFVADVRAPTPSAAAEIVVPDGAELNAQIHGFQDQLRQSISVILNQYKFELNTMIESYAFQRPYERIFDEQQRLDDINRRILWVLKKMMEIRSLELKNIETQLLTLDPTAVLSRGYSIIISKDRKGEIINSVDQLSSGSKMDAVVSDGKISGNVDSVEKLREPIKYLMSLKKEKKKR